MARRKIEDEAEARLCIEAQSRSGLSAVAWARREGLDGRSLNAWRVNLARRGAVSPAAPAPRLVELVAIGQPAATYSVRCGRFVVEVGERFDEDTLLRLLHVVAAC